MDTHLSRESRNVIEQLKSSLPQLDIVIGKLQTSSHQLEIQIGKY